VVDPLEALIYVNQKRWETPKAVGGCWSRWRGIIAESHRMHGTPIVRRTPMVRYALIGLAAAILVGASLVPDDAFARRGGGMRAGGFHGGGAVRAGGFRGGAVAARGYRGGAVAVRGGRVAGGYGYRGAYRAGAYRGYGYGVGAAAVGAAAVGAAAAGAYYRGGCGYDAYGNWVCPNQYYPY
jgi:hypothetical protein